MMYEMNFKVGAYYYRIGVMKKLAYSPNLLITAGVIWLIIVLPLCRVLAYKAGLSDQQGLLYPLVVITILVGSSAISTGAYKKYSNLQPINRMAISLIEFIIIAGLSSYYFYVVSVLFTLI